MKMNFSFLRFDARSTAALLVIIGLVLLLTMYEKNISFEEEVRFSDGRIIRISRQDKLGWECPEMRCGPKLNQSVIEVSNSRSAWQYRLHPIILDEMEGVISIIAIPNSDADADEDYRRWPAYVQFDLTKIGWVRSCLNKKYVGHDANLLLGVNWQLGEQSRITLEQKTERNKLVQMLEQSKQVLPGRIATCEMANRNPIKTEKRIKGAGSINFPATQFSKIRFHQWF